jgi:uncharacterized damage-inducible protein DinB
MKNPDLSKPFLDQARRLLHGVYWPRIERCVRQLSQEQIWWRANPASNSAGNLALHLEGNARQWVVSGLGGAPDTRQRDKEFAERGPIPRRALLARLQKTVNEACGVLGKLSSSDLSRTYTIQGYRVTGLKAVFHVAEHFSQHAGQIILATKMLRGQDLGFTHLPREATKKRAAKSLPAV